MTYFFRALERFGNAAAVTDMSGVRCSYAELANLADQLSEELGTSRQLVALEASNSIPAVVGYLGALRGGHAVMLIDPALPESTRDALYERFSVSRVLRESAAAKAAPAVLHRSASAPELHPDLVQLLATSGSTGSPKFVRLSGHGIDANARSIASYLELRGDERGMASLPIHYSYGLSILNSHLTVGASVVLTDLAVTNRDFWQLAGREEVTSLAGVPAMWEIIDRLGARKLIPPSVRYATQAGGRLSPELVRRFGEWAAETGRQFFVMYGQTEATARIAYLAAESVLVKPSSIGRPIPGGRLMIVSDDGEKIELPDVVGQLIYEGPNVMLGYAEEAMHLARGDDLGGRLHTGDLGYSDIDGDFFISGRLSRFAKLFGRRVNLDEVEGWLRSWEIEGAVTQRDDVLLVGVVGCDAKPVLARLTSALRTHHSAIRVKELPNLPRSAAGKVLYADLARLVTPE